MPMNFSAVILAGGKSSRMGRDKAWLEVDGEALLSRQVKLVRQWGAGEIFISGRPETNYSAFGCPVLSDKFADAGPLAGIERALAAATSSLLLVLAVDLPALKLQFLQWLIADCRANLGTIPRLNGRLEPLVAVYPKAAHFLAESSLAAGQNAVGMFATHCVESGLAQFKEIPAAEAACLTNWNYLADLATGLPGVQTPD